MSVTTKVPVDVINDLFNTNCIRPKLFKDYLEKLYQEHVQEVQDISKELIGTRVPLTLTRFTLEQVYELAESNTPSFKEFCHQPDVSNNLTDEDIKDVYFIHTSLNHIYHCQEVLSMSKWNKGTNTSVMVDYDYKRSIEYVIRNKSHLSEMLDYISKV